MEGLDDIVHEFLVESRENLDQLDSDLVALEESRGSRELLGSVFRTIHTIKGTSGFLAFGALERLTHVGESLLVELRDGRRTMDEPTTDALLRMVDTVRAIMASIEATGVEGDVPIEPVVAQIEAVLAERTAQSPSVQPSVPAVESSVPAYVPRVAAPESSVPAPESSVPAFVPRVAAPESSNGTTPVLRKVRRTPVPRYPGPPEGARPTATQPPDPAEEPRPVVAAEPERSARLDPVTTFLLQQDTEPPTRTTAGASIRVDVDLLDVLMRQVSELVLARNTISRIAQGDVDPELVRASQRLSLIATELQEGVMKTRMQPIEHLWSKMPRMVRDLASACDRKVRLHLIGGDTELDRGLLEAIKGPLTHLIRNAIGHGIESPEVRRAAGKPTQGVLLLRAFHADGQVLVEVSDDGIGIDPELVASTAVRRGLRTATQTAAMGPAELLQLVFMPGFSTMETVSKVSGRGVGMDVVRTKIEAIGGTVDVDSTVGRGTTWRLRIPLTLAIMPALTVECAGQLYEIPQVSLLELVALNGQSGGGIEYVRSAAVYRLRGELLPLVDLREVFEVSARSADTSPVIAVLQAETRRFGLLVDRVLNTEEIVVKPLSPHLKTIGLYAGATLLGDGRVALILDVPALARRSVSCEIGEIDRTAVRAKEESGPETDQVLVAGIGSGRRVAIPLSAVTRLEKLPISVVERVGGREVVQYRGAITPLVRLDQVLGAVGHCDEEELTVVVSTRGTRSVAIVVHEIVDIVDDDPTLHSDLAGGGLVGSTVLKEHVTELLDVRSAVASADPLFFGRENAEAADSDLGWRELMGV